MKFVGVQRHVFPTAQAQQYAYGTQCTAQARNGSSIQSVVVISPEVILQISSLSHTLFAILCLCYSKDRVGPNFMYRIPYLRSSICFLQICSLENMYGSFLVELVDSKGFHDLHRW